MCITVGNVSFEDCDLFTWSLGCTNFSLRLYPRISAALFAITSLAFMLLWVPLPVCQITSGK
uniref:Pco106335 n=1 Tax=Arundo donax TaxID=35708 RepID=A0A0A9EFL1_ARUDO